MVVGCDSCLNTCIHYTSTALQEAGLEREAALETLRAELEAVAREELLSLKEAHSSAMARLQEELTGKASDLEAALRDLERLRAAMTEKEEGLGSATGHIESLRAELGRVQRELGSIQQQWEGAGWENGELKVQRIPHVHVHTCWVFAGITEGEVVVTSERSHKGMGYLCNSHTFLCLATGKHRQGPLLSTLPPVVPGVPALPARGCPEGSPGGAPEDQDVPHTGAGAEVAAESQVSEWEY